MPISEFQQSQVSKLFDKYFPGSNEWTRGEFIHELADVLSFAAENETQAYLYTVAKEYEYVLKSLHEYGRKVQAVKFIRQAGRDRYGYMPSLYDSKYAVDHMWFQFNKSRAGM